MSFFVRVGFSQKSGKVLVRVEPTVRHPHGLPTVTLMHETLARMT